MDEKRATMGAFWRFAVLSPHLTVLSPHFTVLSLRFAMLGPRLT